MLASRYAWHEFWYREFGRNLIEKPRSQAEVTAYVSKYVVKDGEVDFSPNFGEWMPPKLDYTRSYLHQNSLPGLQEVTGTREDCTFAGAGRGKRTSREGVP